MVLTLVDCTDRGEFSKDWWQGVRIGQAHNVGNVVQIEGVAVLVDLLVCGEDGVRKAGGRAQLLVEKGDGVDQDGVGVTAVDADDESPSAETARSVWAAML